MLLVVRFWEEFDENRDLARRIVGVFALVVFRRQNRRHSFTMCLRVLLRDQTRARKKSVIRSTMRDARGVMNIFCSFFFFLLFFLFLFLLFSRKRRLIFTRSRYLCVCARESERAVCARNKTFLKWKKMYGKEIGSERATKRPKKYVSFSLSRNEEEKDDDFRSERE